MRSKPETIANVNVKEYCFSKKQITGVVEASQFRWTFTWSFDKGLLLVHMHPKRMQKELPFIKSEWIRDGDTQQFLKYLGNLSKEVWTATFIKYKGIEFTSISKNEEI